MKIDRKIFVAAQRLVAGRQQAAMPGRIVDGLCEQDEQPEKNGFKKSMLYFLFSIVYCGRTC
jgi:hypothetical protein